MIVIVSWYADGSGQPEVGFHNLTPLGEGVASMSVAELVEHLRDTEHKECVVYDVTNVALKLYDSTGKFKEREQ